MRLALFGHPVNHSLSPPMHRAAFLFFGIAGSYELFDVDETAFLSNARLRIEEGLSGFNATIPHKHSAFDMCSSHSLEARLVGAANTVRVDSAGSLHAHNTDLIGFMHALNLLRSGICSSFDASAANSMDAIVVGSGGAARACVVGLILSGYNSVCVIARRAEQAQALCGQIRESMKRERLILDVQLIASDFSNNKLVDFNASSLIVNCTPIGLTDDELPPWSEQLFCLTKQKSEVRHKRMFFDTVYKQDLSATPLIKVAQENGLVTCDGFSMLVAQATHAFQFWTGRMPPYKLLDTAARAEIESRLARKSVAS